MHDLRDETFRKITDLMYSVIGLSFSDSKKPLVSSRLSSRIQRLGLESFEDYFALIAGGQDGGEFQMAVDLLTTNETYFFREPAHYALLEQELTLGEGDVVIGRKKRDQANNSANKGFQQGFAIEPQPPPGQRRI